MAGVPGTRCRTVTLASLPSRCPVCAGDRTVAAVLHGRVSCPHCTGPRLPILEQPWRADVRRGAA